MLEQTAMTDKYRQWIEAVAAQFGTHPIKNCNPNAKFSLRHFNNRWAGPVLPGGAGGPRWT